MSDIRVIEQKSEILYPDVLFSRPLNKLQMPQIGLLGGNRDHLKILNDTYQVLLACSNRLILAVPISVASLIGSQVDITLEPTKNGRANDTLLSDRFTEANLVIVSPGLPLTSEWHIRLDKVISEIRRPILVTEEAFDLVTTTPELLSDGKSALILTAEQAVKLAGRYKLPVSIQPSRGIFNKIDLIVDLSNHTNAVVILLDESQLVFGHYKLSEVGLVQQDSLDLTSLRGEITALIGSFIAAQSTLQKQFEGIMTACYILKSSLEDRSQSLDQNIRQILNKVV